MVKKIMIGLITVFLIGYAITTLLFNLTVGYALTAYLIGLGTRMYLSKKPPQSVLLILIFGFIIIGVLFPLTVREFNSKVKTYQNVIEHGGSLSVKEKSSIYALNLAMCTVGFIPYPEIAIESFLLFIPDGDGVRNIYSSSFLKSHKIKAQVKKGGGYVAWSPAETYTSDKRYALYLNPCYVTLSGKKVTATVNVAYPPKAVTSFGPIKIEEGLFHYLQDEGWLYPYKIIWHGKL